MATTPRCWPKAGDAELAFAFRHAAKTITAKWYAVGTDDSPILVVLYNYRHALELGLKAVIKALIASLRFEDPDRDGPSPDRRQSGRNGRVKVVPVQVVRGDEPRAWTDIHAAILDLLAGHLPATNRR